MLKHTTIACGIALLSLATIAGPHAQSPKTVAIQVSETTGIRRTEYPVSARVPISRGVLADTAHARLRVNETDAPAQISSQAQWDDGSVRALDVDFNVSIGPGESRTYQLEYGAGVVSPAAPRGLAITETADAIQIGNVRFGRRGAPLVLSASYRGEFIGAGANGVSVTDAAGSPHELVGAESLNVEFLKRGPLLVVLQYSGRLPLNADYASTFTVTCEMPNSKSWVKTTIVVTDPGRRVREVALETPLAFGAKPWTWDFGGENGTYGAFRNGTDSARLTQTVSAKGNAWDVQTAAQGELRPYETSVANRAKVVGGWGHLLDAERAMAFAIDRFASERGVYTIALNGQGHVSFRLAPEQPQTIHRLTVYQHFVGTPVPIGAATSPTAMLNPLSVTVRP